jgi:hypothetical protein
MGSKSNLELLGLPNCIGLSEGGKCNWLNNTICKGERCTFKHSASEYKSLQINTFQRLASLSASKQIQIACKYFNGKKPWDE